MTTDDLHAVWRAVRYIYLGAGRAPRELKCRRETPMICWWHSESIPVTLRPHPHDPEMWQLHWGSHQQWMPIDQCLAEIARLARAEYASHSLA